MGLLLPPRILGDNSLCSNYCLFCLAFPHKIGPRSAAQAVVRNLTLWAQSHHIMICNKQAPPPIACCGGVKRNDTSSSFPRLSAGSFRSSSRGPPRCGFENRNTVMPFSRLLIRSAALGEDPRKWPFVLCLFIFAPRYTCLCLSVLAFARCVFPLLVEHLRASSVTDVNTHTLCFIHEPRTNIMCSKTHTRGYSMKKSLQRFQSMSEVFLLFFSDVSTCIFPLRMQHFIWPWPTAFDFRARTGWASADQTAAP